MEVAQLLISDILPEGYQKRKACIRVTEVQKAINAGAENKLNKLKNTILWADQKEHQPLKAIL